jgi:serine O-acetyltransferase
MRRARSASTAGSSMRDPDWSADLRRYGVPRPFLKEQSIWSVWIYRFGRRVDRRPAGPLKRLLTFHYWAMYRVIETLTGISLPKEAVIGPGLRIWHFGSVIVHPGSVIGARCTLRHGVTIGNRVDDGPVPVIGDDVDFGAYAQALGGIRVGNRARIGAMSVVLQDVPDDSSVAGNPARIIRRAKKTGDTDDDEVGL